MSITCVDMVDEDAAHRLAKIDFLELLTKGESGVPEAVDYMTPRGTVFVANTGQFIPDSLDFNIFNMMSPVPSAVVPFPKLDQNPSPRTLSHLETCLEPGTMLVGKYEDRIIIERVGSWFSEGVRQVPPPRELTGDSENPTPSWQFLSAMPKSYSLVTQDEGKIYLRIPQPPKHLPQPTLFLPYDLLSLIYNIDTALDGSVTGMRHWSFGGAFPEMAQHFFVLKDKTLVAQVNAIYDAVNKEYAQRQDRCTLEVRTDKVLM